MFYGRQAGLEPTQVPKPMTVHGEVAFRRGFITGWAREYEGPVPPRAREALAIASRKATNPDHQSADWKLGEVWPAADFRCAGTHVLSPLRPQTD
jgi:hypothetical protein